MKSESERIIDHLPHRDPFIFVSSVTCVKPGIAAMGSWNTSGKEPFFAGHFPGDPLVPGVLIAESMAQFCGVALFAESEGPFRPDARLARIDVKFLRAIAPPAVLDIEVQVIRSIGGLALFHATAKRGGAVVAEGEITLAADPRAFSPKETAAS